MRILVLGAGGIGGTIASRLVSAGLAVSVCARTRPVRDRLVIRRGAVRNEVPVTCVEDWQPSEFDCVILTVRPNQLTAALAHVEDCQTTYIVCQNGLCEGEVRRLVGPSPRVLGAVISWAASRVNGEIIQVAEGITTLGHYDGDPLEEDDPVVEMMRRVHPIQVTQNLAGVRWSKLALNAAASALCILSDGKLGRSFSKPRTIRVGLRLIEEVCHVAHLNAVKMEPIQGTLDLHALFYPPDRSRLKRYSSVGLMLLFALRYSGLESSMWRAMQQGEQSGIEHLCGAVVAHASPTLAPWNAAVRDWVLMLDSGLQTSQTDGIKFVCEGAKNYRDG